MESARLEIFVAADIAIDGVPPAVLTTAEREAYRAWLGFAPAMRAGASIAGARDPFLEYHRLFAALVRAMVACRDDAAIVLDDDTQLVRRVEGALVVHRSSDLLTREMLSTIPRPYVRRALKPRR
jgi:hypothetical protein